ncbi:GGDEF domain-containing protein [Kamptonema cortianum]|nr:GGDEF domain-containing protein [Geitlerinema splendidum]MDK3156119.1 GGDEF domain-containing protein [Kamptonema cortianum]
MAVAFSITWFWVLLIASIMLVSGYAVRVIQAKLNPISILAVAGSAVLALSLCALTISRQYVTGMNGWQAFRYAWTQNLARTIELNARDNPQHSIENLAEISHFAATTGEVDQVVLLSRSPDGKLPVNSRFDQNDKGGSDIWGARAAHYSNAWDGKPQIHKADSIYEFAFPITNKEGKTSQILVARLKASAAQKQAEASTNALALMCSLVTLCSIGLVALFFEARQNSSAQRVAKAQLQLQQEQIKAQLQEITERTQAMAYHQDQLAKANSMLHELATTDGLTGVMNHRTLMEFLAKSIAQGGEIGAPVSVILLDVDNFKQLNDQYGHVAGDEALRTIAQVLKQSCPKGGAVGRYGGEEFLVILPGASESVILSVAEELRKRIQLAKMSSRTCTASFGASTVYSMSKSDQALIDEADQALYMAKKNGKNQVVHYGHGMLESA